MKLPRIIINTLFLLLLVSTPVYAAIPASFKVYYTWGGFDIVCETFQRIALMMSDARYKGLFFAFTAFSLGAGIIGAFAKSGLNNPHWAWIRAGITLVIGVAIYFSFVVRTSSMVVYDESYNKSLTIGDVPDGLVLVAGLTNAIERGLVDIIWTSASPDASDYKMSAAGTVFDLVKNVFSGGVNLAGTGGGGEYVKDSIKKYTEDCVLFEIKRPGSSIDINDFNNTNDFRSIFNNAASLSVYTTWYDNTNRAGICVTCAEANTRLNTYFSSITDTSPVTNQFFEEKCGKSGVTEVTGSTGVSLTNGCKAKVVDFVGNKIIGGGITGSQIVIQSLIANEIWNLVKDGNASAIADRQTGLSLSGAGMQANEWIPIIRSVTFSIFISLFPFIALFIPTTLFPKVLSFIFGCFIFLTSWGICDALIHSFAMDRGLSIFKEVQNGSLGLRSLLLFEGFSTKALAIFGAARFSSIAIAATLSTLLGGLGASAMAQFAGNFGSTASGSGSSALDTTQSPDKKAYQMHSLETSIPTQTVSNRHGFQGMGQIDELNKMTSAETARNLMDGSMGGTPSQTASNLARSNAFHQERNAFGAEKTMSVLGGNASERLGEADALYGAIQSENAERSVKEIGGGSVATTARKTATSDTMDKNAHIQANEKIAGAYGGTKEAARHLSDTRAYEAGTHIETVKDKKAALGPNASHIEAHTAAAGAVRQAAFVDGSGGIAGARQTGNVEGHISRQTAIGNEAFAADFGWGTFAYNQDVGQVRATSFPATREAVGEWMTGQKLSSGTVSMLEKLNNESGGQYLQEAFKGVSMSKLSPEGAKVVTDLARKSNPEKFGNFTAQPGDSVVMDMGYNPKTKELEISNISAHQHSGRYSGHSENYDINKTNINSGTDFHTALGGKILVSEAEKLGLSHEEAISNTNTFIERKNLTGEVANLATNPQELIKFVAGVSVAGGTMIAEKAANKIPSAEFSRQYNRALTGDNIVGSKPKNLDELN